MTTTNDPEWADENGPVLQQITKGDRSEGELLPLVYGDLKRLAASYLRQERQGHLLDATGLVHETYLRMVASRETHWQDRSHLLAIAARIMRHILTDHARHRCALKRGAGRVDLAIESIQIAGAEENRLDHLDAALTRLAAFAPRPAKVVQLRFFGGMTEDEVADHLEVCSRTVKRDWTVAKAWLRVELSA